jgi:hypothetical protein
MSSQYDWSPPWMPGPAKSIDDLEACVLEHDYQVNFSAMDKRDRSPLAERKTFIKSFVKEVKVTGDEVLPTYTLPVLPGNAVEERLPVLSIVRYGGR